MTPTFFVLLLESLAWRGWIAPDGTRHEMTDSVDHNDMADYLLKKFFKGWDWEKDARFSVNGAYFPSLALEARGWMRVVSPGNVSTHVVNGITARNLLDLWTDYSVNDDAPVRVDMPGLRGINHTAGEVKAWLEDRGLI